MPVPTITVADLVDGQEVEVPFGVSGTAENTPPPNNPPAIVSMAWQIDSSAQQNLPLDPAGGDPIVSFSFEMTAADCPQPDTWYMLTIYCWDASGDLTLKSITFKRAALELEPEDDEEVIPFP